ncbi:VOC family protein [Planosporangium thailandense]|uniref:VOC family protein n=1 Tax=Planosporangium thailandense TaxID=765197 RepID=A0ABX0XR67_9ACTN|nr:VOC family protein [Planosporangium thailandense]NJC68491.1 VOC family protein [Planosporangium thailandense]
MAYDFQVTIDAADPHALADWWAEALGWLVEPTDEAFIRRVIAEGHATEDDTVVHNGALVWKVGAAIRYPAGPGEGPGRRVLFQLVPEAKTVKNRVHLDVRVGADKLDAELERLTARGATFLHRGRQGPYVWITVADPEGNEFCIT